MAKQSHAEQRAEVRRRNRLAAKARREAGAAGTPLPAAAPSAASVATPTPPPSGTGLRAALRGSFTSAPIRADLKVLPSLLRTRAFFLPLALTLVVIVVAIQPGLITQWWVQLAVQSILLPPAFVLAFLGGMLTRRGSWMMGALFGIISYLGSLAVASLADLTVLEATNPIAKILAGLTTQDGGSVFGDLYFVGIAGALAGAFAGWYGRFLRAMTPATASSRERRRTEAGKKRAAR